MIDINRRYKILGELGIEVRHQDGEGSYRLKKNNVTLIYNNDKFLFTMDKKFYKILINDFNIYGIKLERKNDTYVSKEDTIVIKKKNIREVLTNKGLI